MERQQKNERKRIEVIAMDLDGTLLHTDGTVGDKTVKALRQAFDQGVTVIAATGRSYMALPEALGDLPFIRYVVTSNGSSIFDREGDRRIYKKDMPVSLVIKVLNIALKWRVPYEIYIAGESYCPEHYFEDPVSYGMPENMREYVRTTRKPVKDMTAFTLAHLSRMEGMNLICGDMAMRSAIRQELLKIEGIYVTAAARYYLEVADRHVSKAKALDHLVRELGHSAEQVAAFGDGENDIEMLEYAGTGVAMGNAAPETRERADYVTLTNDEDGIADFLANIDGCACKNTTYSVDCSRTH